MLSGNIKLYNLPTDILDKICYENDLDNTKLALLIMAHKSFHEFIMIKYKKLYLSSLQKLQLKFEIYFKRIWVSQNFSIMLERIENG